MNIPVEKMNVEDMMEINEHDWMAITVVQSNVVICFFFFFFFSSSSILFFVFFFNFFSLFPTMAENDRSEDERNILLLSSCHRHHLA